MLNPLLTDHTLPPFSQITPEHIKPAIEVLTSDIKQAVADALLHPKVTWKNLVEAIDKKDNQLFKVWSPVRHMNAVVSNDELRKAHDECLPLLSELSTWIGQHAGLYAAYKELYQSKEFALLMPSQQRVIKNQLRDFKLSGIALAEPEKSRFGEIKKKLSDLRAQFSNNVLDANKAFSKLIVDIDELKGLPESALAAAKQAAKRKKLEGWLFTLDAPSFTPIITYCENRNLRKELYTEFYTRASELGSYAGDFDNSAIMNQTLALKHELATILGFDSYAEYSVATKMAESPAQVMEFLNELAVKAKAQAHSEMDDLRAFALENFKAKNIEPWDLAFYSEKQKQSRFSISDEILRPYFPENTVLSGLFTTANKLFGIEVVEVKQSLDTWHPDVRFFEVRDENGHVKGSFYLDLYARTGKRSGAWMAGCSGRVKWSNGELQKPIAFLTCNFTSPVGDEQALFTHREVITLFHEFGHGLHFLLTEVDEYGVSGISGVAWDAIELPSQFMENWCWQEESLSFISGHYQSGEALPAELLEKMMAAKNYNSAMQLVRQIELALFDFSIHHQYSAEKGIDIQKILDDVRKDVAVTPFHSNNRFQHSFQHIFAGGYSAGYYSYKWAEVLSADAFSKFEEDGIFNKEAGKLFKSCILEKGGSDDIITLFTMFRGRAPKQEALLRYSGIDA